MKKKLRILLTSYNPFKESGGSISVYFLAKALIERGHKVYIASTGDYPEIPTIKIPKYKKIPILQIQERIAKKVLSKIIKEKKIDIIHAQDRLTIPGAISVAKKFGIVSAIHFRAYDWICPKASCLTKNNKNCNDCSYWKAFNCTNGKMKFWNVYKLNYIRSRRKLLKEADIKISISSFVAKKMKGIGIESKVVANIREFKDSPKKDIKFKEKYKLKKIVLSYLGRLEDTKGIVNLVDYIKEILKENKNICLFIAGEGPDRKVIEDIIKKENLKEKIVLAGKIPYKDIAQVYLNSDVILFPPVWNEPFSGIPLEAINFGKPIIASKTGGTVDSVIEGKTGFLVNPLDKKSWQESLLKLINNKRLRENMGKEAKKRAKLFSSEKIGKEVEEIYYNILEKIKT